VIYSVSLIPLAVNPLPPAATGFCSFDQLHTLLDALVSRYHKSRPPHSHYSLPALYSARQLARYATAHSTTRPFSRSSADSNTLDNESTCSVLLSPTVIRSNPSPPPTFSATFYPSSTPAVSPSSSLRSSFYSSKAIRMIARYSVSSSRNSPATNSGKSAQVGRSANRPWVRNRATIPILDLIALLPSPASPSPAQASSAAAMPSIAKLIIYRHVRIVERARPDLTLERVGRQP